MKNRNYFGQFDILEGIVCTKYETQKTKYILNT